MRGLLTKKQFCSRRSVEGCVVSTADQEDEHRTDIPLRMKMDFAPARPSSGPLSAPLSRLAVSSDKGGDQGNDKDRGWGACFRGNRTFNAQHSTHNAQLVGSLDVKCWKLSVECSAGSSVQRIRRKNAGPSMNRVYGVHPLGCLGKNRLKPGHRTDLKAIHGLPSCVETNGGHL
jgi:hypothetical protein